MPEKNPPKGSAEAEQRARDLAGTVEPRTTDDRVAALTAALEEIAGIAANGWAGERAVQEDALRRINEAALRAISPSGDTRT